MKHMYFYVALLSVFIFTNQVASAMELSEFEQNKLPSGSRVLDHGKTLNFDNQLEFADYSTGSLTPLVVATIKSDKFEKIIVDGKLMYMGSGFEEMANIIPQLKTLKTLYLDLNYGTEHDDQNVAILQDTFKECHGLILELAFSRKVSRKITIR